MNESQRKWLQELQGKGVMFEYFSSRGIWTSRDYINFNNCQIERCRLEAQSIPDIPDWREVCRDMQRKGVKFEYRSRLTGNWVMSCGCCLYQDVTYRIPAQPLPEWREDMIGKPTESEIIERAVKLTEARDEHFKAEFITEMNKLKKERSESQPESKQEVPEVPHKDLQIQWHEDKLHSLRTGEPMREWEVRYDGGKWYRVTDDAPSWYVGREYRRKPRTKKVTYWHCVVEYTGYQDNGVVDREVFSSESGADEVQSQINGCKENYPTAKFSHITETTVEIPED